MAASPPVDLFSPLPTRRVRNTAATVYVVSMRTLLIVLVLSSALPAMAQERRGDRIIRDRQIERQYQRRNQPFDPSGTRIFGGQPQQQRTVPPSSGSATVPNR